MTSTNNKQAVQHLKVDADDEEVRLDRWLRRTIPGITYSRLVKWIRTGQIRIDGQRAKPGQKLLAGQIVRLPPIHQHYMCASRTDMDRNQDSSISKVLTEIKNNILYLRNKNPRKLLAEFAAKINYKRPNNLVAVTGTNGKSSIANFYFQILKQNKKKVASIGTLGIQSNLKNIAASNTTLDPVQLALQLKKIKEQNIDHVILEASSHGLKQNRLDGLKFKTGIFTNLSHDHLDLSLIHI